MVFCILTLNFLLNEKWSKLFFLVGISFKFSRLMQRSKNISILTIEQLKLLRDVVLNVYVLLFDIYIAYWNNYRKFLSYLNKYFYKSCEIAIYVFTQERDWLIEICKYQLRNCVLLKLSKYCQNKYKATIDKTQSSLSMHRYGKQLFVFAAPRNFLRFDASANCPLYHP